MHFPGKRRDHEDKKATFTSRWKQRTSIEGLDLLETIISSGFFEQFQV